MTLLVIGSNGQLGREVMQRAAGAGHACLGLTKAELDITDRAAVLTMVHSVAAHIVVNTAGYTAVDEAEDNPGLAFAVNCDGAGHVAEACARIGVPLIHISTDYVFDGSKTDPYLEDDLVAPLCVYGASKLAGEDAIRQICSQHVILRTAWLFGVHGPNFVKTMLRLGSKNERLQVVDDQRGSPTFAGDLAEAILMIAARLGQAGQGDNSFGTFHCVGSGTATRYGLARKTFEAAASALGFVPAVEPIATSMYRTQARRPANSVLDCSRLKAVHGIALRRWEPALVEMLESLLSEQAAEPCSSGAAQGTN